MCHSNKHPVNDSCLSLKHTQFPKLFLNSKETISIDGIFNDSNWRRYFRERSGFFSVISPIYLCIYLSIFLPLSTLEIIYIDDFLIIINDFIYEHCAGKAYKVYIILFGKSTNINWLYTMCQAQYMSMFNSL